MELVSPDGKLTIDCHPSKVDSMINKGWKEVSKVKAKPAPKKEEKTDEEVK
jgi:hypothetical protein